MSDIETATLQTLRGSSGIAPCAESDVGEDGPRQILCGLLRHYGISIVTFGVVLASVGMSALCGLVVIPVLVGPVTMGTLLVSIVIPAIVAPPIVYISLRLLHDLDSTERRLQRLTITDELTRVYNRRFLLHSLQTAFSRARRYREDLSVLMMDVDHFKSINDRHGHQAGDLALVEIARRIGNHLRNIDILARYGGEEFVAILPNTGHAGALVLAERVRQAIADAPLEVGPDIPATISIGVASLHHGDELADVLIGRADAALYQAKAQGRDRVVG